MHSFTTSIRRSGRQSAVTAMISALLFFLAVTLSSGALAQANSADAAAQQALARSGGNGKVLSVREKTNAQGQTYYEVQIISNGNVRVFNIPRS